jgi:hypothetical protein
VQEVALPKMGAEQDDATQADTGGRRSINSFTVSNVSSTIRLLLSCGYLVRHCRMCLYLDPAATSAHHTLWFSRST